MRALQAAESIKRALGPEGEQGEQGSPGGPAAAPAAAPASAGASPKQLQPVHEESPAKDPPSPATWESLKGLFGKRGSREEGAVPV